MALSNKFGALVLTTGNKSEMAVGYCTLYGDMNGALAPARGRFQDGHLQNRALGQPRARNHSARLPSPNRRARSCARTRRTRIRCRPTKSLDAILDSYVVKNLSKAEIIARGFDAAVVNDVINKINFSEYKRRQAAPGLKVSPRAFGMGRRIPIAQKFRATV